MQTVSGSDPSAVRDPVPRVQEKFQQALALHQAGQLVLAQAIYEEILTEQPAHTDVVNLLGAIAMQAGDLYRAVELYDRAIEIDPTNVAACCNSAMALMQLRRFEVALARYDHVVAMGTEVAEVYFHRGNLLGELKQYEAALTSYRRAIELEPEYAEAHVNSGDALHELQQYEAALASYRRAIAIVPDYEEAHCHQGVALIGLRRFEAALTCFEQAIALKPDYAEAYCNHGNVLMELKRSQDALASYRHALELKPSLAEAHNGLGNAWREFEQHDAALASYRQALEINPHYAEAHLNLGSTLLDLARIDAAADSYQRALECKPRYAEAHYGLSIALRLLNRTKEAERHCRRALEIEPDFAKAIEALARVRADQGHFAEAEALYRRAISIAPDLPEAWSGIAGVRKMTAADAPWLAEVQRIAGKALLPRQQVHLLYALGKYFDDVQDFEQAFIHYRRANELSKRYMPTYDPQRVTAATDALIQTYDQAWLEATRINTSTCARPVFVVGMPRSGTTLAEQILASHPAVFGAGEMQFWHTASLAYLSSERNLADLADDYLRLLADLSADALRVVDKMPANFENLGLIHAALPGARIIHMQRHPIDTCLSIYFQNFAVTYDYANDLENLAHFFREYQRVMAHWHAVLPADAILDVPYEQLVEDQEGWSRKMLEFIGLPWDPSCLQFHQTQRAVVTASSWQVRQKINKSSIARWRNYEQYIGPLLPLAEPDPSDLRAAATP